MGAMEANCGKCLHQKVCALWWAHERQDASCFSLDGCDCFEAAITPPNEPLTLDELRKMKDEPTYLKVFDPLLKSGWHIVKAVTEDKIIFRDWQTVYVPIDGMGVDYNLYRRPPEGKEDIK